MADNNGTPDPGKIMATIQPKLMDGFRDAVQSQLNAVGSTFEADVRLDTTKAHAQLRQLQAATNELSVGIDTSHAVAQLRALSSMLDEVSIKARTAIPTQYAVDGSPTAPFAQARALGGAIQGPGGPRDDMIPAWLSNGEYVVNAAATAANRPLLEAINSGAAKFADGGMVEFKSNPPIDQSIAASMIALVKEKFPNLPVSSDFREGASDWHGKGRAVDFSNTPGGRDAKDTPEMNALANFIADNFKGQTHELIHDPFDRNIKQGEFVGDGKSFYGEGMMADHRNHVHWAATGPVTAPGGAQAPAAPAPNPPTEAPKEGKPVEQKPDIGTGANPGAPKQVPAAPAATAPASSFRTSQNGREFIKAHEGNGKPGRPFYAYQDDGQFHAWTIGYGHTGDDFEHNVDYKITSEQADEFLQKDLVRFEAAVKDNITVPLNQNQFDALVSFAYNLGGGWLLESKSDLTKALNRGDYEGAKKEFMGFELKQRRADEAALFGTPVEAGGQPAAAAPAPPAAPEKTAPDAKLRGKNLKPLERSGQPTDPPLGEPKKDEPAAGPTGMAPASEFSASSKLVDLLKGFEGNGKPGRPFYAYTDTNGIWTIGYGHTGNDVPHDTEAKITPEQAEEYLRSDTGWAQDAVRTKVKVPINQNQFDAMVSFTYNLGAGGFGGSDVLARLNEGDYAGAQEKFGLFVNDSNGRVEGLVKRRQAEADLFGSAVVVAGDAPPAPNPAPPAPAANPAPSAPAEKPVEKGAPQANPAPTGSIGDAIVAAARSQLNVDYAWGGGGLDGPSLGTTDNGGDADRNRDFEKTGFDCSHLVEYAVWQGTGKKIDLRPNTVNQLAQSRDWAVSMDELQPGDVIFGEFGPNGPMHVGIVASDTANIIDAPESGKKIREAKRWGGFDKPARPAKAVQLADGGFVSGPGGPREDKIPALLSNGEFVINAAATQVHRPVLEAINSGDVARRADGGPVYSSWSQLASAEAKKGFLNLFPGLDKEKAGTAGTLENGIGKFGDVVGAFIGGNAKDALGLVGADSIPYAFQAQAQATNTINSALAKKAADDAANLAAVNQQQTVVERPSGAQQGGAPGVVDQSMVINISTPDVDTAFQKAKTFEAQRALTYTGRWT
ncbi:glycoside hydrolase family protein [Nocardia sp. NPDC052566]|uniref:glycoside hydrolase family protein n=1 Tax=Nocardia sp. NPDC052566 TaxID=3364330 RepID=UPI0037C5C26B